jgi:hypothetical protein
MKKKKKERKNLTEPAPCIEAKENSSISLSLSVTWNCGSFTTNIIYK